MKTQYIGSTENAGLENAGLEDVRPMMTSLRDQKCSTGKCGTENAEPENAEPKICLWKMQDQKMWD